MKRLTSVRTALALAAVSARYRLTVADVVRSELAHWRRRAEQIDDPQLRALALAKLRDEGFNAAAAAMLATLTPRGRRHEAVRAIVALEVLFDYLDGQTEMPVEGDPIGQRRAQFAPLIGAIPQLDDPAEERSPEGEHSYEWELSRVARSAIARLEPRARTLARMHGACVRGAEAQVHLHSLDDLGTAQIERWATSGCKGSGLGWREYLAGAAASILSVHAIIATCEGDQGPAAVDDAYLHMGALATLLDGIVDHFEDTPAGMRRPVELFAEGELEQALENVVSRALSRALELEAGATHGAVLAGLMAYYTTAPGARSPFAHPLIETVRSVHPGLLTPASLVLGAWRAIRDHAVDVEGPAPAPRRMPRYRGAPREDLA